ncbi:MAG TPA: hypothetical protein V6D20_06175, partial [Candidatus Obscuribacterales bacterium]
MLTHNKNTKNNNTQTATMRIIRDAVYGYVALSDTAFVVSESRPYQRLKSVRQLGASDLVFPQSGYKRYDHSLGVAHL